jgi:hypothetical protein
MKPYQIPYRDFLMTKEDPILKPFVTGLLDTSERIELAMISKGICCVAFLSDGIVIADFTKFKADKRIKKFLYSDIIDLFVSGAYLYLRTEEEGEWKVGSVFNQFDMPLIDEAREILGRRKACVVKRDFIKVDLPSGKIKFYQDDKTIEFPDGKVLEWNKVAGVEVVTNDGEVHKTGLGRAVAGGILLGEVGLIAGAASGKKTTKKIIYSTDIYVKTNDLSEPVIKLPLFSGKMKSDSKEYPELVELTQKLVSMFEIIIKN